MKHLLLIILSQGYKDANQIQQELSEFGYSSIHSYLIRHLHHGLIKRRTKGQIFVYTLSAKGRDKLIEFELKGCRSKACIICSNKNRKYVKR